MKKYIVVTVATLFFGAYLSAAMPEGTPTARRQATVNFWKTVKTALEKEGYQADSPELKRAEKNLHRAKNRLSSFRSFYAPRGTRPERHHRGQEKARHAEKARHVRGAGKKETREAKASTKRAIKDKAKKAGSWWNRTKAEVGRLV